jgi:hypothetical protein
MKSRQRQILQLSHDRATRYLLTVPLITKSAATAAIHHAIARIQLNTGRTVRRYHADNARKQHAEPLLTFLLNQGTEITSTTPHTSQKNAQAERAIRTIFNATRSALAHSKLGNSFWTYAAADATRKRNALPTTQEGVTTSPHERLFGTKLVTDNLLPFGHRGFVTSTGIKSKLDARAYSARQLYQLNDAQYVILNTLTNLVNNCRIPEFHPLRHTSRITSHQVSACTVPKTLQAALNTPDATEWVTSYDEELDRHQINLEPKLPGDTPRRHSSNSHKNQIPTALHLARKCAVPFAAKPWYQALSMILKRPARRHLLIPACAFSLPSPPQVVPLWNHGTTLAHILKLTPILTIGKL